MKINALGEVILRKLASLAWRLAAVSGTKRFRSICCSNWWRDWRERPLREISLLSQVCSPWPKGSNFEAAAEENDPNLERIRKVLRQMDTAFKNTGQDVSSRAVAVSAHLFAETLMLEKKASQLPQVAKYYSAMLNVIEADMELVSQYEKPKYRRILDEFQKYVLQASVEPYSIRRRHEFLRKDFGRYRSKGKIQ